MNKQLIVAMTSIAMIASSCVSTQKSETRNVAGEGTIAKARGGDVSFTGTPGEARPFGPDQIRAFASASDIKLIKGQVLTSNDEALNHKIEMIKSAKSSIRMVYFIYADDDSSSLLNQALIAKAKSGVKVTLLVDFVTNFGHLDLFSMLERESNHNITTHFYNVPTDSVIQDANYMVLPCPKGAVTSSDMCYQSKRGDVEKQGTNASPFAKILLAGLYGKNATAIKTALGFGAGINPADYKSQMSSSDPVKEAAEKKAMLEFVKVAIQALVNDDFAAKIKLSIAMMAYSDKLNPPVNELTGRLPIRALQAGSKHGELWDHITDYTHHKLIAVDQNKFQLGGRNVEDSYHMTQRVSPTGKYIFVDTDFWGETADGGTKGIEKAFDNLVNGEMVSDLKHVKEITDYDFIANSATKEGPGPSEKAVYSCAQQKAPDMADCIAKTLPHVDGYQDESARLTAEKNHMDSSAKTYLREYVGEKGLGKSKSQFGPMSPADIASSQLFYLENFNYNPENVNERVIGSVMGSEYKNNKNIQAVWYRDLENACLVSRNSTKEVRVIFHSAYLLMPSGMVNQISRMMNGSFGNCSNVHITFVTNSPTTTDLGPINLLARYQLGAIFSQYDTLNRAAGDNQVPREFPSMDYYELASSTQGTGLSLHTKTTLIGDDLIVGSANADIRSYYMDTNNAIMIKNAHELNAQYVDFIQSQIASGKILPKMKDFVNKSAASMREDNLKSLTAVATKFHQMKRLDPEHEKQVQEILGLLDAAGARVTSATQKILNYKGDYALADLYSEGYKDSGKFDKNLNQLANKYDSLFKMF